jgi:hypothetical protein
MTYHRLGTRVYSIKNTQRGSGFWYSCRLDGALLYNYSVIELFNITVLLNSFDILRNFPCQGQGDPCQGQGTWVKRTLVKVKGPTRPKEPLVPER